MTFYARRERFGRLSEGFGRSFSRIPLSPNQWTLLSLGLATLAALLVSRAAFLWGALLFLFSAFLDTVDGAVARHKKSATKRGAYLDTIADRYAEFVMVLGIASTLFFNFVLGIPLALWALLYLFGAMMTTYSKAAASEKGLVSGELRGGLLERGERMLLLFAGLVLAGFDPILLGWVVSLAAVLTNVSALQRIAKALRLT
jgi:phosphatidylglycerophosphate synthase